MKLRLFITTFLLIPFCSFADDIPAFPSQDPTPAALSSYYNDLSKYYQNQAKVYAKKAQDEEKAAQVAQNTPPYAIKNPKPFNGTNAGLGFVMNTGNTNTQNFNGSAFVSYIPNKASTTTWNTTYQNSHDDSKGQISNKFYSDLNSAYNFDAKNGMFGDINFTRDTFSGYNYQANESTGYNRTLYQSDTATLTGQIGPGLQQNSLPSPQENENLVSGNLKLLSTVSLSNQTNWRETYGMTTTSKNTNQSLDSLISTVVFDEFAVQLDYLMSYDTTPLAGKSNFNTMTTISLVYNF